MDHAESVLRRLFDAAVDAVEPRRLVREWLERHPLEPAAVIAAGKAAPAMALGAADAIGVMAGLVITNRAADVPPGWHLVVAGHPIPNEASLEAGSRALDIAAGMNEGDLLLVLLSGGASALMEALRPGVTLEDLTAVTSALLRSGATIHEVNAVRRAISTIKGGGLAAAAAPAAVTTLAVSDVVGDDPGVIGSGPTVVAPPEVAPGEVVARLQLADRLPPAVRRAIAAPPAPAPAAPAEFVLVASGETAARGVMAAAETEGLAAGVVTTRLAGEASEVALWAVGTARSRPDDVCVFAGEATVTVRGDGTGGRNQQAVLAAALALEGHDDLAFLAAGTDGIDGPTPAAGAVVDGTTAAAIRVAGIDPLEALERNDAYPALAAADALLVTGDTGTNVGDVWITLRT